MTAEALDYSPVQIQVTVTAGDSVAFRVLVDDIANIPEPVWSAQVRDGKGDNVQDFMAVPEPDGCAFYLSPEQTRNLSLLPGARRQQVVVGVGRTVMLWQGEFDVQLAYDAGMVRTLARGTLKITWDVTR